MGFSEQCVDQAADWMLRLYDLFIEKDAVMVEINPMSEDLLGRGTAIVYQGGGGEGMRGHYFLIWHP